MFIDYKPNWLVEILEVAQEFSTSSLRIWKGDPLQSQINLSTRFIKKVLSHAGIMAMEILIMERIAL